MLDHLAVPPCAQHLMSCPDVLGQLETLHERSHHQHGQGMHIIRESRRGIATRQLLGDETVRLKIRSKAAMRLGDAESQES